MAGKHEYEVLVISEASLPAFIAYFKTILYRLLSSYLDKDKPFQILHIQQ